ncbi:MAG: pyridoxine 5'-phosphate synthase, partial [Gemmatimonadales bacterium]
MRLYVNIDHVATLRQARRTDEPDPLRAAAAAERGGTEAVADAVAMVPLPPLFQPFEAMVR